MNLKDYIRSIQDYPKKGILFRDITTLIKDKDAFAETINQIVERSKNFDFDKIAAIESRGFVFASAVSYILKKPFIMLRKKNKLPAQVHSVDFELEYGKATIEVHKDSIEKNDSVLIIDDLIATGGTAEAAAKLIEISKKRSILFHSDCVQVIGKLPLSVLKIEADYMSFSAHKFYGPKGIGFLYRRKGAPLRPLVIGGGQESNIRAGTENISGIAGLGVAAKLAYQNLNSRIDHLFQLEKYFKNNIIQKLPHIIFNGNNDQHIPGLCSITIPRKKNEIVLAKLDRKGIEVSNGSACSSGTVGSSPILKAIGVKDKLNKSTIRISFGRDNTIQDVSTLIDAICEIAGA